MMAAASGVADGKWCEAFNRSGSPGSAGGPVRPHDLRLEDVVQDPVCRADD